MDGSAFHSLRSGFRVPSAGGKLATVQDAYGSPAAAKSCRAALSGDPCFYAYRQTPDDLIFNHDGIWMWRSALRHDAHQLVVSMRARQGWPVKYPDEDAAFLEALRAHRAEHTRLIAVELAIARGEPPAKSDWQAGMEAAWASYLAHGGETDEQYAARMAARRVPA